jgi:hypothetical protein
MSNLGIIDSDCATTNASDSKHRLEVCLRRVADGFIKMTSPQLTLNLSLREKLHIVSNSLNKTILPIDFLRVIDMQPTRVHFKYHIRTTLFLPMHDEPRSSFAIISHPKQTDNILEANYICHCSEPHPEFIAKDHTFLGDTQSPAIARHFQCSLGFSHPSRKVRVAI